MEKTETKIIPAVSLRMGLDKNHIRVRRDKIRQMGFDFGDRVLLNGNKGYIFLRLAPAYKEDLAEHGDKMFVSSDVFSRMTDRTAHIIRTYAFLLGADPEFFLVWKNGTDLCTISANAVIKEYSDYQLGEIRPKPTAQVEGLIRNIRKELQGAYQRIKAEPRLRFYGSSYLNNSCGGFHIHFNMPQELLCFIGDNSDKTIRAIVSLLDSSVGLLSRFDPNAKERINSDVHYGRLGDFRLSMETLEYRVPGAYWLRSEETCRQLLGYSYSIFQKILIELKTLSKNWKVSVDEVELRKRFDLPPPGETKKLYKSEPRKELALKLLGKNLVLEPNPDIINNWRLG